MPLTIDEIEALEIMCALAYESKIKRLEEKDDDPKEKEQRINEYEMACAALARIKGEKY